MLGCWRSFLYGDEGLLRCGAFGSVAYLKFSCHRVNGYLGGFVDRSFCSKTAKILIDREARSMDTNQSSLQIVNFLDVTLNLTDGSSCPYRNPNNTTQYIDARSHHPPSILKHLPIAINRRISGILYNKNHSTKPNNTTKTP